VCLCIAISADHVKNGINNNRYSNVFDSIGITQGNGLLFAERFLLPAMHLI
jgi:hypothetical protein